MAVPEPKPKLTEAEYLALERAAEVKSEFLRGEMFAMAGGSLLHSRIATNLATHLSGLLRGKPCRPFNSDLRLKVEMTGLHAYPDLSVLCGPPSFTDESKDTVTNPVLLAEVLSESTEAYDRGRKFESYRLIPTLQEYLLVSQWAPQVELFSRVAGGGWRLSEASGMDAHLVIPALEVRLSLAEVFDGAEFPPPPPYVLHDRRRA